MCGCGSGLCWRQIEHQETSCSGGEDAAAHGDERVVNLEAGDRQRQTGDDGLRQHGIVFLHRRVAREI